MSRQEKSTTPPGPGSSTYYPIKANRMVKKVNPTDTNRGDYPMIYTRII
ncbi:MAG TPA: hypothetical protein GXX31_03505 [Methanothermobacter sp.]|nr:hypothetical protein [Methanobacteriales archaeon]MDX9692901.1 hypothetical protein [Methanothermobacter sp.]HHW16433.1 hypothetical protein [Methanothermobacter sp.]